MIPETEAREVLRPGNYVRTAIGRDRVYIVQSDLQGGIKTDPTDTYFLCTDLADIENLTWIGFDDLTYIGLSEWQQKFFRQRLRLLALDD